MINVIADQNLYRLEEFIPEEVSVTLYDPASGIPDISGYDAWLLRTDTKVNPQTLPSVPETLKFVGTGSSGSDHVDIDYLKNQDVTFADARGCNARAVAEYVMTSLLLWREETKIDLTAFSYGIIGVGAVGSAVAEMFSSFGFKTVLYDPPRQHRDPGFTSATLENVLQCDVLTFHVPFKKDSEYPTHYWLDKNKLANNKYKLIINAARGGILDEQSVLEAKQNGRIEELFIDVWENEPDFNPEFANQAFIATPHIAGYSEQSKLNASQMIAKEMCRFFGLDCPSGNEFYHSKILKPAHDKPSFKELLLRLHPVKEYDAALRDLMHRPDKPALFGKLRTDRPYRYEYRFLEIEQQFLNGFDELSKLGVRTIGQD